MSKLQTVFKRVEKKYMLDQRQYEGLCEILATRMQPDEFGKHAICNIYFDTEDDLLIRRSMEKPIYKEKLRLRSYGTPGEEEMVYAEIKKKYQDVVYKRREALRMKEARVWLMQDGPCPAPTQIGREVAYLMQRYQLKPRVYIAYDRVAMFCPENPDLRITFDTNIRWRAVDLDLTSGDWGSPLLEPDRYLMEIKIPGALPLWLCRAMEALEIRQQSFSKYGTCYQRYLRYLPSEWRAPGSKQETAVNQNINPKQKEQQAC